MDEIHIDVENANKAKRDSFLPSLTPQKKATANLASQDKKNNWIQNKLSLCYHLKGFSNVKQT